MKKFGTEQERPPMDKGRYQRLVGKPIHLSHTPPDHGFRVSVVSQFINSPREDHLEVVLRIIRYLKMTPGKGLYFENNNDKSVKVFTDVDWVESPTDRRSTSRYCTYVWEN